MRLGATPALPKAIEEVKTPFLAGVFIAAKLAPTPAQP
jgi:hypothetical protein